MGGRVGLVCGHYDPVHDGVADYTRNLARHLTSADWQPVICTASGHAGSAGVDTVLVTDRWSGRGIVHAAREIAKLSLDVVHVQFAPSAFRFSRTVGLLPALLQSGTPIVTTLHEYGVWAKAGVRGRLAAIGWSVLEWAGCLDRETLLLPMRSQRLLVCAPDHGQVLQHRFPRRKLTPVNVPIGPNISFAQQQAEQSPALTRRRFGLPLDAVVVIFFGFLHPEKGLERLIEAVSRLRPAIPAIRLVMAGGLESHSVAGEDAAKLRHDLQSVARANGLERDVIFTGYLPEQDVSQLLQTANAAVFPFNAGVTGKSGSLLAAQAHGVPTIATHRCDMSREAADVEGVLRIPPCDTAALTDALRKVLTDPRLASRLARAGRAHAAKHTWQAIVGRHAQIYAEIRSRGISSVRSRQPDRSMASAVAVQANVVTRMEDHVVAQAHNRTAAGSRG